MAAPFLVRLVLRDGMLLSTLCNGARAVLLLPLRSAGALQEQSAKAFSFYAPGQVDEGQHCGLLGFGFHSLPDTVCIWMLGDSTEQPLNELPGAFGRGHSPGGMMHAVWAAAEHTRGDARQVLGLCECGSHVFLALPFLDVHIGTSSALYSIKSRDRISFLHVSFCRRNAFQDRCQ